MAVGRETVRTMTQTVNGATQLALEHDEIDRLAARIATLGAGPERTALLHEVCARFLIHVQAEERYLHPAMRRLLRDGASVVAHQACRDHAVARTIERVERGEAQGDQLDVLVGHLVIGVQDHVEQQDAVLLPALIDACPIGELKVLGEKLREGMHAAREAAERAGAHLRAQGEETHGVEAVDEPCRGFRALLRRIARPNRLAESG
jgi:hypothetical protein